MTAEWGKITAKEIIKPVKGELVSGNPESPLNGVSTDTREIAPGQVFLALRGETYDGHNFVGKAVEKGASAVITEKESPFKDINGNTAVIVVKDSLRALGDLASWWRQQHDVKVAAITGSTGKTTTKEMAACILDISSATLKNKGNFNNLIGLPLTLLGLKKKHLKAVLEMGTNRPGEIARLTKITAPYLGLITNIGKAHLEGFTDIKGVAGAKTELLEQISPDGTIILNGDDNLLMKEASRFKREIVTFGVKPYNMVRAENIINRGEQGNSFNLIHKDRTLKIDIRAPGSHNIFNALAASAIAIYMGADFNDISKGLSGFTGIAGRFEVDHLPGNIILIDDTYNSNPTSLKAALDSINGIAGGKRRIIVGLGEMMELGGEAETAHREAGKMVAEIGASRFYTLGVHSRDMLAGALENGLTRGNVLEADSPDDMIKMIVNILKGGDLIFLKGSRKTGLDQVSKSLKEWTGGLNKGPR